MAEPDIAHKLTDEELAALEKQIEAVYGKAYKEIEDEIREYFSKFAKRDAEMKKLLEAGEVTKEQYTQWRLAQLGRGERMEALKDNIAERMTRANEVAIAYVNDRTPGIYSLNRNYAAYRIELVHPEADFVLWDEQTVRRLIMEQPELLPYYPPEKAVKRGIDLAYEKKKVGDVVTGGILMGKGISQMADDLQREIVDMNRVSALRAARTAVTGAQNAGRQDGYVAAERMGIKIRRRWTATKDGKTRHDHGMADGQLRDVDEPFNVGGYKLMFPGDPSGPPHEIYNCRCTIDTREKEGIEAEPRMMRVRDPETGRNVLVREMTYQEWAEAKRAENPAAWERYMKQGRNASADRKQYEEYRKILGRKVPGRFEDFQKLKYNSPEKWDYTKNLKQYLVKYPTSNYHFFDAMQELKDRGIKKGVLIPANPKKAYVLSDTGRDGNHILKRMVERNITDDELRSYVDTANAMFVQWGGKRQFFVGEKGMAVIKRNENDEWIFKTGWKKEDFDNETELILEVLKKNGI